MIEMSQSLSSLHVHLVFSTLGRTPFLKDENFRSQMHSYLGAVSGRLGCPTVLVGGVEDHVHVLARLGKEITLAGWIKELKRVSSGWAKGMVPDFKWQSGYGAFGISTSDIPSLRRYIEDQEAHHHVVTFQEEFLRLLEEHGIEHDLRYLWD